MECGMVFRALTGGNSATCLHIFAVFREVLAKAFDTPTTPPLPEYRVRFRPYEVLGIDATGHVWLKAHCLAPVAVGR